MSGRVTRRIVVRGRVQGVGFRDWTIRQAAALGVSGWVRNRGDGSVEIVAAGDEAAVSALQERCWQGPSAALVAELAAGEADEAVPPEFEWRPTARQ